MWLPLERPLRYGCFDLPAGLCILLYAFDLYERIYEEAWHIEESRGESCCAMKARSLHATFDNFSEFKKLIPKLIIENNIHKRY